VLGRSAVTELLSLPACIEAVEAAFCLLGEGRTAPPGVLGHEVSGGGFHLKVASLERGGRYFAAKVNGNFPENPERGLPTIQGVVVLCHAETGTPLAILDSAEVTALRTAAATAVAARRLARPDSTVATIVGCGVQGRAQLRALLAVLPLTRAFAVDRDRTRAVALAEAIRDHAQLRVDVTDDLAAAVSASDVCITCTPARRPILRREWVRAGTFVAAVGADAPGKQELEPTLLAAGRLVVDVLEQCAAFGELAHALREGLLPPEPPPAELGQVVAGLRPGRETADEITVFDSTGTAIQDVAVAALAYERAVAAGRGASVDLAG
jgi:alanine dehydrogenase